MANNKNIKIKNYSPLRYPGGKVKLYPLVSSLIKKSNINNTVYIEPFAGGAGLALSLLYNNDVDEIVHSCGLLCPVYVKLLQVGGLEAVLGGVVPISLIRGVDNLIS